MPIKPIRNIVSFGIINRIEDDVVVALRCKDALRRKTSCYRGYITILVTFLGMCDRGAFVECPNVRYL